MDELRVPSWAEAQNLTTKQLNEVLRRHGKRGYSNLNKTAKLQLLTGQEPPSDYVPRKMPQTLVEYNQFRTERAKEWDCSVIEATKRIKEEGLWTDLKAKRAAEKAAQPQ